MKLATVLQQLSRRTLLLVPLLLGLHVPAVHAEPVAVTTLDVCQNDATGNWRYSGVVSVRNGAATDTSVFRVGYVVQNKVSTTYYTDAYLAPQSGDTFNSVSQAKIIPFSVEAAPLVLGSMRGMGRVEIYDPANAAIPALTLAPVFDMVQAVCGCQHPTGCTRTQGYWSSKPNVVWPAPYSRNAMFYSSGLTWQQILDTAPRGGNAYIILAHQYIAAVLNKASGASVPAAVQTVINNAATFFTSGTNLDSCANSACETQKTWAGILDTYNNGAYPGGPKHCPD